jgi:NAD(P)-dependent dehydrogenase (short-subunit alcohol dehydrogenase family)
METNFFDAMHVIRAALPALRAQRSGAVVNIWSLGGPLSFARFGAYSATKFALEGVSEALNELKTVGVKVLIIEPGQFRTNLAGPSMRHMPVIDAYREVAPYGSSRTTCAARRPAIRRRPPPRSRQRSMHPPRGSDCNLVPMPSLLSVIVRSASAYEVV